MEGYKVIKDFSFAEKGDVFTKVEDLNLWELQKSEVISDTETYTSMAFDSSTMEELANKDYVIWYSEEVEKDDNEDECECCCDKLEKVKEYVNGAKNNCENYSYDYSRKTYEKDEIYKNGIDYSSDDTPIGTYIFILIVLIILGLIFNVFTF